jgi:hypothetical protein
MTVDQFFFLVYAWCEVHAGEVFAAAIALPIIGTLAAMVGKAGKTDADGRLIASVVIGIALAAAALEVLGIGVALGLKNLSLFDANLLLLVAPVISKFRGWSVVFFGSFGQLLLVGLFAGLLLWRLYRRAFGGLARSSR